MTIENINFESENHKYYILSRLKLCFPDTKSFCNKSLNKRLFLMMSNPISFQKLGAAGSIINYFYYSSNLFPRL